MKRTSTAWNKKGELQSEGGFGKGRRVGPRDRSAEPKNGRRFSLNFTPPFLTACYRFQRFSLHQKAWKIQKSWESWQQKRPIIQLGGTQGLQDLCKVWTGAQLRFRHLASCPNVGHVGPWTAKESLSQVQKLQAEERATPGEKWARSLEVLKDLLIHCTAPIFTYIIKSRKITKFIFF